MSKTRLRLLLALAFVLAMVVTQTPPAIAAEATFSVTVKSVYLRAQPGFGALAVYSVFEGQQYAVVGRTADNSWFQLDFAGASGGAPWVYSGYGSVAGYLPAVPVTGSPQAVVASQPAVVTFASSPVPFVFVRYTVAVKSFFGLAAPDWQSERVASLFDGQTYQALARSTDSLWLRLELSGGAQAWVPTTTGTVDGPAAELAADDTPIAVAAPAPPPARMATSRYPIWEIEE